jgi:PadR family transcriptional regulator
MRKVKGKFISRSEEFLLLAVFRLKQNAYGVTIREQLQEATGKTWAYGALFVMLNRMEKKGLLESFLADPTPQRGGRSKRIYRLTGSGVSALEEVRRVNKSVWSGISEIFPSD